MIDDCRDVDFLKQSGRCSRAALLRLPAVADNVAIQAEPPEAKPPKRKRRWFQFSLRTLLIAVTLCACLLGAWAYRDYLPGTVRRDENGFIHGTGTIRSFYPNGAIQAEEDYRNGLLLRQRYYRPDGSVFGSSEFDVQQGGTEYYLSDDGTLRAKVQYKYSPATRSYLAEGQAVYYKPDGSIDHTVEYRDGQAASSHP